MIGNILLTTTRCFACTTILFVLLQFGALSIHAHTNQFAPGVPPPREHQPPPHHQQPPPHHQQQQPHRQQQPPHHQEQPPHHQQPPHHKQQPPHHQEQPPHHQQQPPHHQQQPPHQQQQQYQQQQFDQGQGSGPNQHHPNAQHMQQQHPNPQNGFHPGNDPSSHHQAAPMDQQYQGGKDQPGGLPHADGQGQGHIGATGDHAPNGGAGHIPRGQGQAQLHNHITDKAHMKEHMDGQYQMNQDTMSDEEMQFHYFKIHDYDNNNKLDGIELVAAVTHYHSEEDKDKGDAHHEKKKVFSDEELANFVDQILEEDDFNKDGYVDYTEFVRSQRSANGGAPPAKLENGSIDD